MKRPFPSRPGLFERTSADILVLWGMGIFGGGMAFLVTWAIASLGNPVTAQWHAGLLTLACVLLLPLPFFTLPQMQAQRRVWLGRVAPRVAWQQALADHRQALVLSWALAAVPLLTLRLLSRSEGEAWATTVLAAAWPAALLAGLLGLALLAAAASSRLLGWRWGALAAAALLALLLPGGEGLPAAARPPLGSSLAQEHAAPGRLAGALTLAMMALTALLAPACSRLVHARLAQCKEPLAPAPSPWKPLSQTWQRCTERWRLVDGRAHLGLLGGVLPQLPFNMFNKNPELHFFQAMGSGVGPLHGLRIAVMTLVATVLLRGAVQHWRLLLAPGGRTRRTLGLQVVGSTLVSMLAYFALCMLILALILTALPFLPGVPWARLPGLVLSHGLPLVADLALAVALAAWLRGWLGSLQRVGAVLGGFSLLLAGAMFIVAPLLGMEAARDAEWWTRGPLHLGAQLALAALCTVLAQRVWARADLGEMARRSAAGDAARD